MLASFDITVIETVGVGQSEIDIARMSDTTCFVAQPGSGDTIQYLKAGIMEIPHVLVVNKEDMGAAARKTVADLRAASAKEHNVDAWQAPILSVSATQNTGIDRLAAALDEHYQWLAARQLVEPRRRQFQVEWIIKRLQQEFGTVGVAHLRGATPDFDQLLTAGGSPFAQFEQLRATLQARWQDHG
jgi:LAO/AO transport system kinase